MWNYFIGKVLVKFLLIFLFLCGVYRVFTTPALAGCCDADCEMVWSEGLLCYESLDYLQGCVKEPPTLHEDYYWEECLICTYPDCCNEDSPYGSKSRHYFDCGGCCGCNFSFSSCCECEEGDTKDCTQTNGCPGYETCDGCNWNDDCDDNVKCPSGESCPHDSCHSGCWDPDCAPTYSCGTDSCSSDGDCGDCSPGSTRNCTMSNGCPGTQTCGDNHCWGSCWRTDEYYRCSGDEYCPYDDCYSGSCENRGDRGCGIDQCDANSDCRHDECVSGDCTTQYDDTSGLDDLCSYNSECRHYECDRSNCGSYCTDVYGNELCNCGEETCRLYYDDVEDIADTCCVGCSTDKEEGYVDPDASVQDCCDDACPTETECANRTGGAECCGQGDGCGGTCSDCDVSDGDPFTSPTKISAPTGGTPAGTEDLPVRVNTSSSDVLNPDPLSATFFWEDTDSDGCEGLSRSDTFPFRIDNLNDGWDCSNPNDHCEDNITSTDYTYDSMEIGTTYSWWVHARNTTCASYEDCCDGTVSGVDDWSGTTGGYVCRPDCNPLLCGQNDNCGAEETLDGFNGFDGSDDDCYATHNGNPNPASSLESSLDGDTFSSDSGIFEPAVLDPSDSAFEPRTITFRWAMNDAVAQDDHDNFYFQVWYIGDPTDPNYNAEDFNWSEESGEDWELVYSQDFSYPDYCDSGVCELTPTDQFEQHVVYAWRVAHHNVTCETSASGGAWIDVSGNVGTDFGQVDTLDPDDCPNSELCAGDGSRDWSEWADGYFLVDNLPEVISITPTCNTEAYCWAGNAGDNRDFWVVNPENIYAEELLRGYTNAYWPWARGDYTEWDPPSDQETQYCGIEPTCEDMTLQNNPEVFEVVVEDVDGWQDISHVNFSFTAPGEDSCSSSTVLGEASVERESYDSGYDSDTGLCYDVSVNDETSNDWTVMNPVEEKMYRISENRVRAFFKARFNWGEGWTEFRYQAGDIRLCANGDDFFAGRETSGWEGDPDWDWKVDLRAPELDRDSSRVAEGNEIVDLKRVDLEGVCSPCDPSEEDCSDDCYDTWQYEVHLAMEDAADNSSGIYLDYDRDKMAPDDNGDGFVTLEERLEEEHTEESEISPLAWYRGDYNGDGSLEWIRLPYVDQRSYWGYPSNYPFYYDYDYYDASDELVIKLFVPAEDEEDSFSFGDKDDVHFQRTHSVRAQIRDFAGNISYSEYTLFAGWFQAINGDLYSNYGVDMTVPTSGDDYDLFLLASDPAPPPSTTENAYDQTSGGLVIYPPGVPIGDARAETERPHGVRSSEIWLLSYYDAAGTLDNVANVLGFSVSSIYAAGEGNDWDGSSSLSANEVYVYDPANGPLSGEYEIDIPPSLSKGVAIVYVTGDLVLGEGEYTGTPNYFRAANGHQNEGIILIVEGGVLVEDDIQQLDAFVIALGQLDGEEESIVFRITKLPHDNPLVINGSMIAEYGFDVSRYIFDLYKPALQVNLNPLYFVADEINSLLLQAKHTWREVE